MKKSFIIVICVALLAFPPAVFAEVIQRTRENDVVAPEAPAFGETVHMQANDGAQGFTIYGTGEFQFQSFGKVLRGKITKKEIQFGSLRLVVASKTKNNDKQHTRIEYSRNGKKVGITHIKGAATDELLAPKEFYQLITSFADSEEGRLTAELGTFLAAQRGQSAFGEHQVSGVITCTRDIAMAAALGAIAIWSCTEPVCGWASYACCVAAVGAYLEALEAISEDCVYNPPVHY